jgi:DTW domain-containing protein YfiP
MTQAHPNSFQQLQTYCRTLSTREFKARGSLVERCNNCMMAKFACFCEWKKPQNCELEFILIMHRNEVHKPTNTGRLIADIFPENTQAFLWDRTEPSANLLDAINDNSRQTVLLFPSDNAQTLLSTQEKTQPQKPLRIVLLDGTWKQASKMARLSKWLQHLPHVTINTDNLPPINYIREAPEEDQLSTAQAAACALADVGERAAAEGLYHYFGVFNQHSKATRKNITPEIGESHIFLEKNY